MHQLFERFWGLSAGGWERWREIVARYWGYVTMIDDLVGRILDELEALGLAGQHAGCLYHRSRRQDGRAPADRKGPLYL